MKKSYINPNCRVIDLLSENMIATSPNSMKFDNSQTIENEMDMLTNKQDPDLWGNESVWK